MSRYWRGMQTPFLLTLYHPKNIRGTCPPPPPPFCSAVPVKIIFFPAMLQWPKESCYSQHRRQHIVLVIRMEFPAKHYQVSVLLTRKEFKLSKCQEIPIISAGGKKHFRSRPWCKTCSNSFFSPNAKWQILFY